MIYVLDLFCGEGGAGKGYQQAGMHVTGVDLVEKFRKRYPGDIFYAEDALLFLDQEGHKYDFIHASPPCQKYSITNAARKADYPDLIDPVRSLLNHIGVPYVIENVPRSPLINPVTLCWTMFRSPGSVLDEDHTPLQMQRHRLFESNWGLQAPTTCDHAKMQVAGSYGGARRDKVEARTIRKGGYVPSIKIQQKLLEIDWMTQTGMWQSIPPMYSKYIGEQFKLTL